MRREDKIYQQEYGHIPNDQLGRIKHILGNKADDPKFNEMIAQAVKKIKRIKWKKLEFTMWKTVLPSPRPRAKNIGYIHMYVPGAKKEGDWFEEFAKENNLPFINTPCIFNLKVYRKTPSSFNKKQAVLAELGIIRPWNKTGDFDNYAKGVADAIQHGMLDDDCLIGTAKIDKYYSIKPRAEVEILYMEKFPEY